MANYVDGFVLAVQRARVEDYRRIAEIAGKVWLEYGVLEYRECVAEDVKVGKVTSFPQAVKLEDDEVVVFSWIVYRSREERDRINAQVMADPRITASLEGKTPPFDMQRLIFGGFTTLVALDA